MSWSELPLGELPIDIIDGDRGKNYPKQNEFQEEGYCVFLSATNVTKSGFKFDAVQFIDEQKDSALRKGKLSRNDVVLTTRGTIGNSAFFNESIPYENMRINSGMVILRVDPDKFYAPFLYSYLRSQPFLKKVDSIRSGAAQPQLPIRDLVTVNIPCPDISEQIRASEFISSYDNLIENNRRRIQLLEESARLLYQEWFVHLRFPGHEKVKITDGVPEGWEQSSIGEASSYLNRGITPKYSDDGEYVVINQKCIRNRVLSLELARRQSKEYKEEKAVRLGDILINSTGTGTLGRVAQVWEECEKTSVDTHVTIVRPATDIPYLWLGYCLLGMERRLEDMGEGATNQKELKRQYVADISILKPSNSLMEMFHNTVLDNTKQIQNLIKANKSLAQARDLLLPKLMSGELTV